MDFRDRSIITQVAFKATVDLNNDIDITDPMGQVRFEESFAYLRQSLLSAVEDVAQESAGQLIRGAFPNTTQVQPQQHQQANGGYTPGTEANHGQQSWQGQPSFTPATTMTLPATQLSVKGNQYGPLPDWLLQQAAEKGVTEVYDNRDRAQGTKRPWFRETTGGDNATAFWPPR